MSSLFGVVHGLSCPVAHRIFPRPNEPMSSTLAADSCPLCCQGSPHHQRLYIQSVLLSGKRSLSSLNLCRQGLFLSLLVLFHDFQIERSHHCTGALTGSPPGSDLSGPQWGPGGILCKALSLAAFHSPVGSPTYDTGQ